MILKNIGKGSFQEADTMRGVLHGLDTRACVSMHVRIIIEMCCCILAMYSRSFHYGMHEFERCLKHMQGLM